MFVRLLLIAAAVAVVVGFVRYALRPRGLFEIRVTRDGIHVHGAVPGVDAAAVRVFVDRLRLPIGSRIRAEPNPSGPGYRLRFTSSIDEGTRDALHGFLTQGG